MRHRKLVLTADFEGFNDFHRRIQSQHWALSKQTSWPEIRYPRRAGLADAEVGRLPGVPSSAALNPPDLKPSEYQSRRACVLSLTSHCRFTEGEKSSVFAATYPVLVIAVEIWSTATPRANCCKPPHCPMVPPSRLPVIPHRLSPSFLVTDGVLSLLRCTAHPASNAVRQ